MGHRDHRWRRDRPRLRGRCRGARLRRRLAGTIGLRQRHVEPFDQAGARRGALPPAGKRLPGHGGARRARPAAAKCTSPGARRRLHRPQLRVVGVAVLRHRPPSLRSPRRALRFRQVVPCIARHDHQRDSIHQHRGPARRDALLRRAVRRRAPRDQPGDDRGRPGRDARQLHAGREPVEERHRRDRGCGRTRPGIGRRISASWDGSSSTRPAHLQTASASSTAPIRRR